MGLLDWLGGFFVKKPKPTAPLDSSHDRVVCVGINKYPGCPLSGCVYDVTNITAVRMARSPMATQKTLLDGEATTKNIADALKWLAETPPGARALFWYSGHGAQVPTKDPSEPDGLSECVCPVDFDWSPERMLIDKQLVAILAKMQSGVRFDWGSDSCHSGNLDRTFNPHRNIPKRMVAPPHIQTQIDRLKLAGRFVRGTRALISGKLDVGFISGCRSDQTSADTEMGGQPCGAFTWHFVEALKKLPQAPLSDVVHLCRSNLAAEGYEQAPQIDGPQSGKPFLLL